VPASIVLRELKEIAPPLLTMEPELEAGLPSPFILGKFPNIFAPHIRNGETLLCSDSASPGLKDY
jgi:hypothetical protein